MPKLATKDTYGTELVGGVEVRREVFAGTVVPDSINLKESEYKEIGDAEAHVTGFGEPVTGPVEKDQPKPRSSRAGA